MNKKITLLPSLFAANFADIATAIKQTQEAHIEYFHYDVMDNHFVPNISFGMQFIEQVMKAAPNSKADIHLMIELSKNWEQFLELKPYSLTIHIEAGEPRLIHEILQKIRQSGILAGLSIKPATPMEAIQKFVDEIDLLLIMSVEPGFSFQSFIPNSINKIRQAKKILNSSIIIEADGGINRTNMKELKQVGLDWFVMGGGFFKDPQYQTLATDLQNI